jgi:hypothetical protein
MIETIDFKASTSRTHVRRSKIDRRRQRNSDRRLVDTDFFIDSPSVQVAQVAEGERDIDGLPLNSLAAPSSPRGCLYTDSTASPTGTDRARAAFKGQRAHTLHGATISSELLLRPYPIRMSTHPILANFLSKSNKKLCYQQISFFWDWARSYSLRRSRASGTEL